MCEAFQLTAGRARCAARRYACTAAIARGRGPSTPTRSGRRPPACPRSASVRRPVASLLVNRPEFHLFDTAAMHLGAPGWSLYNTSALEQMVHAARCHRQSSRSSRSRLISSAPLELRGARPAPSSRNRRRRRAAGRRASMADVEAARSRRSFDFAGAWRAVRLRPTSLTLIFTSGSSGTPKCVETTHRNMLAKLTAFDAVYPLTPRRAHASASSRARTSRTAGTTSTARCSSAQTVHVPRGCRASCSRARPR